MNVLTIVSYPFLPATTGGEICTLGLHNELAKKHQVTVFTVKPYSNNFKKPNFELIANLPFKPSRYLDFSTFFRIKKLIKSKEIDLIFFEQVWFGWLLVLVKFFCGKKVCVRAHNIEYLRFKSIGKTWWPLLYLYENITYKTADKVFFLTEEDRKKALREFNLKPENTQVVPYGINLNTQPEKDISATIKIKQKHHIDEKENILLFYGTMGYKPNDDAVVFIVDQLVFELNKHPDFRFKILICGKNLPDTIQQKIQVSDKVLYCGFVDDLNQYIDSAKVVLNPVLSGGGIKTKAIDALARNAKLISTKTGAIGIEREVCGNNLIIVDDDDIAGFASQVILACGQTNESIPDAFYMQYNWENILEKIRF